ncbi:hypothetical protein Tco_0441751, partial [Tanacetum coccineum]
DEDNLVFEAGRVNEAPKRDPENCKGGCLVPIGPLTEYDKFFECAVAAKGPEKACHLIFSGADTEENEERTASFSKLCETTPPAIAECHILVVDGH